MRAWCFFLKYAATRAAAPDSVGFVRGIVVRKYVKVDRNDLTHKVLGFEGGSCSRYVRFRHKYTTQSSQLLLPRLLLYRRYIHGNVINETQSIQFTTGTVVIDGRTPEPKLQEVIIARRRLQGSSLSKAWRNKHEMHHRWHMFYLSCYEYQTLAANAEADLLHAPSQQTHCRGFSLGDYSTSARSMNAPLRAALRTKRWLLP